MDLTRVFLGVLYHWMNTKKEQIKYLESKGWKMDTFDKCIYFSHETFTPEHRFGRGFSRIEFALHHQQEFDAHEQGKCFYYKSEDKHGSGYGWSIFETNKEGKKRLVFNHPNESTCQEMVEKLNKDGKVNQIILDSKEHNYLLVLKEEHGDRYYYVPTLYALFKACRLIVMERLENDYWYIYDDKEDDSKQEIPTISKEVIKTMKEGNVKKVAIEEWKIYEGKQKLRQSEEKEKELLQFIKENDNLEGRIAAYHFLMKRRYTQYENIQFETMEI